jgi:hypothetical protein
MQKLLKQKTTGAVYPWTETLAGRNDMVDYEVPAKVKAPVQPVAETVEPQDDIKAMAKAVLTKKGKANGEASVGETQSQEAQ